MQLRAVDIRLSYVGPVYTLSDTCNNAIAGCGVDYWGFHIPCHYVRGQVLTINTHRDRRRSDEARVCSHEAPRSIIVEKQERRAVRMRHHQRPDSLVSPIRIVSLHRCSSSWKNKKQHHGSNLPSTHRNPPIIPLLFFLHLSDLPMIRALPDGTHSTQISHPPAGGINSPLSALSPPFHGAPQARV